MPGLGTFRMNPYAVAGGLFRRAGEAGSDLEPLPREVEAGRLLSEQGGLVPHAPHSVHSSAFYWTSPRVSTALHLNHKEAYGTRHSNTLVSLLAPWNTVLQAHLSFCFILVSVKSILLYQRRPLSVIHEVPQSWDAGAWLSVPALLRKAPCQGRKLHRPGRPL